MRPFPAARTLPGEDRKIASATPSSGSCRTPAASTAPSRFPNWWQPTVNCTPRWRTSGFDSVHIRRFIGTNREQTAGETMYDPNEPPLFPLEPPSTPLPHNLFFGVRPPEPIARRMFDVAADL